MTARFSLTQGITGAHRPPLQPRQTGIFLSTSLPSRPAPAGDMTPGSLETNRLWLWAGSKRATSLLLTVSEAEPEAAVDDATFERRPRINSPPSIEIRSGPDQRVVVGLPHIAEILGVEKESN